MAEILGVDYLLECSTILPDFVLDLVPDWYNVRMATTATGVSSNFFLVLITNVIACRIRGVVQLSIFNHIDGVGFKMDASILIEDD